MAYVLAISNNISVNSKECFTKMIKFKDEKSSFGFEYLLNPSFYQQVRLHIDFRGPKYATKEKVYRQQDGNFRFGAVVQDKKYDLVTDQFDEPVNDALASALKHSDFYIEDVKYFCQGEYETEDNEFNNLQTGKATLFKQGYNQTNIQC